MAFLPKENLDLFRSAIGPRFLEDKIRNDIQICWLMQDQGNRTAGHIRNVITSILDDELKDIQSIVKDL
jgi:hypothetical protein